MRDASRRLWRTAPAVATAIVLAAAIARWRHASPLIPLALLAIFFAGAASYGLLQRRRAVVSDGTAAAVDDDAGLGGELRSAAWFATGSGSAEPWAAFHVARAAEHLESIDLAQLYPPVQARRARVATAVMVLLVLVLVATFPDRSHIAAAARTVRPDAVLVKAPVVVDGMPADLPQELLDLLAAIENGTLPPPALADAAMRDMLAQLQSLKDPKTLAALARALAEKRRDGDVEAAKKELSERLKRDAAMTPPSDIKDALDELSKKLSDPDRDRDSAGLEESEEAQQQGGVELSGEPPQSSRDASAIAGLGMVSLPTQGAVDPNAPPGVGAGGTSTSPNTAATMPEISSALRHEIIEAHDEDVSSDMQTEARRKTERGEATASFTGGAAATFDGARASTPPHVPETRRAGIQTYFTRKQ
jgi:hypothetical protein